MNSQNIAKKQEQESLIILLQKLEQKIENIENRITKIEQKLGTSEPRQNEQNIEGVWVSNSNSPTSLPIKSDTILLSPIDEKIIQIIGMRGAVCAEDIQKELKYKGQNAASARLARLASLNILKKKQAGRRVYYTLNSYSRQGD